MLNERTLVKAANTYDPSSSVLQQRYALSNAFSAFKRVRPRIPFWQLAAHRIPTLWTLYRGLLRDAPYHAIRWRMRMLFERYKSLTSPRETRDRLLIAHKFLDTFREAKNGNERLQKVLERYNAMIVAKKKKDRVNKFLINELAWQERLRKRSIMTGSYHRPTYSNRPLPRLKPQPVRISMMIRHRRLARDRRGAFYTVLSNYKDDLHREKEFEQALDSGSDSSGIVGPVFRSDEWIKGISGQMRDIRQTFSLDAERANSPFPSEMLAAIKEARREKIRNKRRERLREKSGEVLKCTLARQRQGPPPHLLCKMSKKQRYLDNVARSVSEVGYVGFVKTIIGRKLKNKELWKTLEEGREENRTGLDAAFAEIQKENEKRRKGKEMDKRES